MSQTTEQHPTAQHPQTGTSTEPTIQWYGPGAADHTQPLEPAAPVGPPSGPLGPTGDEPQRPARGRRRWVDVAVAAVVAAVVAGGTTGAVVASTHDNGAATSSTSSSGTGGGSPAAGTGAGPVSQSAGQAVDWSKVATAVEPSVVAISTQSQFESAEGSGVVLDDKGRVLTNNHVVSGVAQGGTLTVTLSDGRSYEATIVGTDPSTDLAVIQMKGATDLTPATLGDSDSVAVGAPVMAVGNPLGLAGTVTTGIVSALDRPVTTANEETPTQGSPFGQGQQPGTQSGSSGDGTVVTNAIQTDAAVNPGNSGGALVDDTGRVVGIPSSIASLGQSSSSSQSGSIGLGFSIPINEAKSIADQLIADGKAEHPFLGVSLKDGTVAQGAAQRNAALLAAVTSGSPAASAGLKTGDAVIAVDGESVNSSESLVAQIRERQVGSTVKLTIVRSGKQLEVTATLTKQASS
ncbi:trypsin-like peptidase domain-containing protein [Angustibacter peucedani]